MGERDPETMRNGALECLSLAAAKARGKKLGTPANLRNQDVGRIQGRAKRTMTSLAADFEYCLARQRRPKEPRRAAPAGRRRGEATPAQAAEGRAAVIPPDRE